MSDLVVAITGASGAVYGVRLLQLLLAAGRTVHLTISPAGAEVLRYELDLQVDLDNFDSTQLLPDQSSLPDDSPFKRLISADGWSQSVLSDGTGRLEYHHHGDFSAGIASGSFRTAGMAICPCSMGTLSAIAGGLSRNLIQRAADVHLKEHRRLVVVPRETPLGVVQLANMQRVAEAGAVVLPAAPGFYHRPADLGELVDFIVSRVCDQLEVEQDLVRRWGDD